MDNSKEERIEQRIAVVCSRVEFSLLLAASAGKPVRLIIDYEDDGVTLAVGLREK